MDGAPSENSSEFTVSGVRVWQEGRKVIWEAAADFDPEAWRRGWIEGGARAAESSAEKLDVLRQLVGSFNALHLVGQVASVLTLDHVRVHDAADHVGSQARAAFLAEVAVESGSLGGPLAGPSEVFHALHLLDELFEAEHARILGEEATSGGSVLDQARFLLRLEALADRMQGYVPHLERIVIAVFERTREQCLSCVGFCPADVPALVKAHLHRRQAAFHEQLECASLIPRADLEGLPVPPEVALMSWVLFVVNEPSGDIDPDVLAADAEVDAGEVAALLTAMTTPWGQPTSALRPGTTTRLRRRPVMEGMDSRVAWPLAWSSLHEALPWFSDLVAERQHPDLQAAVQRARADATEEIVVESLSRIFGEDRVHPQFEYPIGRGNWAECDVVVELPGHAIAIECKSGALADEFRQGDLDYAASTFMTLVDDPFRQSARAAVFLTAGPGKWRPKGSGTKRDWSGVGSASRIAVTLERIDPLALVAARADLSAKAGEATWVVCLADLLMIADILDDPHSFAAYMQLRCELAANPAVAVISESDVLGAFLHDRLKLLRKSAGSGPNVLAGLSHHAGDLNEYFTMMTVGLPLPVKPCVRVPERQMAQMTALWAGNDPRWLAAVRKHIVDRR